MFAGDYSVFEKTSRERLRNQLSKIEAQDKHRKHVQVCRMRRTQPLPSLAPTLPIAVISCVNGVMVGRRLATASCTFLASTGRPLHAAFGHSVLTRALRAPQAFIDKFRYNAKRASMVQSRIKALERLEELEAVEQDPEYVFKCASCPSLGALT